MIELSLTPDETTSAQDAGRKFGTRLDIESGRRAWERYETTAKTPTRPTLHLDDTSAIPFLLNISGVEEYQHRARARAGTGDMFAVSTPVVDGYEDYCSGLLAMGQPQLVHAEPRRDKLAVADACKRGSAFEAIVQFARSADGLSIHPYMGIDDVWSLADKVARVSAVPVNVVGPSPPVTWLANDKRDFCQLVDDVLGPGFTVETRQATSANGMVKELVGLASRHARVALKRTRCASAMGNAVMESAEVADAPRAELLSRVEEFLVRTEWPEGEPVLAVAWEDTDLSPSTQLWLPPLGAGPPVLDGIYEQILAGEQRVFVGSRPSTLPAPVNRALGHAGLMVGAALQALGYVGRCSFDYLVLGDPEAEFGIRFVECNGRWGGTSTPMSLVDRLVEGPRPRYRAQDVEDHKLIGVPLQEILAAVGDELYRPDTGQGRFIFYNCGPLAKSGKLDVIALGDTQEQAEHAMLETLPRLLSL